jgi:hypothetical protein
MVLRNVGKLPHHFTLKMEATWSSETFNRITTRRHNPEDRKLNSHHRENLVLNKFTYMIKLYTKGGILF